MSNRLPAGDLLTDVIFKFIHVVLELIMIVYLNKEIRVQNSNSSLN